MFWHRNPFLLDNICGALSVLQNLRWLKACLVRLTDPVCWPDWSACGADCFACLILLVSSNFICWFHMWLYQFFVWLILIHSAIYVLRCFLIVWLFLSDNIYSARSALQNLGWLGLACLGLLLAWLAWLAELLACSQKTNKNQPFQACQNDRKVSRQLKKHVARLLAFS